MVCYIATALLAVNMLAASPKAPQWEVSYGKALKTTRTEATPLLVVLDKPESREAAPEQLSDDAVDQDLLKAYTLCHVDVTTKYGRKVAKAFKVDDFPHVAIIDKTGKKVIYRKTGNLDSKEWRTVLARHKSGEKTRARVISRSNYRPVDSGARPYCPNCQRNSF